MQQNEGVTGDMSIDNIFTVLQLLGEDGKAVMATGVAAALGTSRGMATRFLVTLDGRGIVKRDERGAYTLALPAAGLARHLMNKMSIVGHARPVLEELSEKHGEAVYLSVLFDDEVIVLDVAERYRRENRVSLVGKRFPALTTTAGKAIRALQSRDLIEKLFRGRQKRVRKSDLEELFDELDGIRRKGVAVDIGSLEEGVGSVAAAVRDYAGKVVCALTVLGPSFRMFTERIEGEIVPSLMAGAELLSEKFGCARMSPGSSPDRYGACLGKR